MLQRRDVLESAVGEWGSVVALGRSEPADLPVEPVIVVVAGEVGERGLGVGQRAEDCRSRTSLLSVAQKASIFPFVPGVFTWVWMWRTASSRRVLPKRLRS